MIRTDRTSRALVGISAHRLSGLIVVGLGLLMFLLYHLLLYGQGPLFSLGGMLVVMVFVATFLRIEVGVGALILAMLLSPEVRLASLPIRDLTIRLEDMLIPTVLLAWLASAALIGERQQLRLPRVLLPLALWTGLALITTLRGAAGGRVHLLTGLLYIMKQLEYFGIFVFTLQYIQSLRRLRQLATLAVVTCLILAFYNFSRLPTTDVRTHNRITAPFEGSVPEPSTIGGYFALMLSLIIALLLYAPRGKRAWLALALVAILPPFLMTLSRTSYVAFVIILLLMAVKTRNRTLIAVLLIALLLSPLLLPQRVIDRVAYTFSDRIKVFGIFDRSLGERIFIWYKVYWELRQRPWLGGGVTYHDVIDSSYARLLIETGVAGTACFVAALYMLLAIGWRLHRRTNLWWLRGFSLGYTVGLVGLMVHGLTAITFNIVRIMEPFWMLSGAIVAAHLLVSDRQYAEDANDDGLTLEAPG